MQRSITISVLTFAVLMQVSFTLRQSSWEYLFILELGFLLNLEKNTKFFYVFEISYKILKKNWNISKESQMSSN